MPKKILLILAHPLENSLCGALADAYMQGAQQAGHDVQRLYLGRMQFDPLLHHGYAKIQPLEPDLVNAQAAITAAQHLVFVYPTWWGAMPALLKGFIDRTFLPGFAFKYRKDSVWWDKLLAGRSANLLVTMDTPPWYFRWIYRMPGHEQMRRTVLEFCGIKPVKTTSFGPVRSASAQQHTKWIERARILGFNA
jgi:NAD(P)H dehydrogenase (quinone)